MHYGRLYDERVAASYDEDTLGLLTGVRSLALNQILRANAPASPTISESELERRSMRSRLIFRARR